MENVRDNYCSKVYSDYIKMLDEIKPDIAFILTENCQKPEVVEECAKRGINVSIENPIAVSFEDAKKIKDHTRGRFTLSDVPLCSSHVFKNRIVTGTIVRIIKSSVS